MLGTPGKDLERRGLRIGEHVRFTVEREAAHAAPVEAHALFEGVFKLARDNGEGLHAAEYVAEPETHKVDIAAFHGFQHEILIRAACHGTSFLLAFAHYNERRVATMFQIMVSGEVGGCTRKKTGAPKDAGRSNRGRQERNALLLLVDAAHGHIARALNHLDDDDQNDDGRDHDLGHVALITVTDGDIAQAAGADGARHRRVTE